MPRPSCSCNKQKASIRQDEDAATLLITQNLHLFHLKSLDSIMHEKAHICVIGESLASASTEATALSPGIIVELIKRKVLIRGSQVM